MSEPGAVDVVSLAADEPVPGRPFADPGATALDLAALAAARAAQRERLEGPYRSGSWVDASGASHRLVAPRPSLFLEREPCLVVGFFGQARNDVDHGIIVSLEDAMLERADAIPGLLSYHNVQFESGRWGNLVLFTAGTDTAPLRAEPHHRDAIRRTPSHYHSLRLHRGLLPDGPLGSREIELTATLYLDFADTPPWRAVRPA